MDAFIARQPVFDRRRRVHGYELLFRNGPINAALGFDPNHASSKVISDALSLPHLRALTSGKAAFVNLTQDALLGGWAELLPPEFTVLEILESVEPSAQVLAACDRLRGLGYRLALDDYGPASRWTGFVEHADIVKVDVLATTAAERSSIAKCVKKANGILLAEKVETRETVDETAASGYTLFQGNFFARPAMVSGRDIPARQQSCLRMLRELHRSDLDLVALSTIIEREVALSYKLLRYVRASAFGWRGPVASVWHALTLLGAREARRWGTVIAVSGVAIGGADELVRESLILGRFCELMAPSAQMLLRAADLFFLGMFSRLDAILQQPMEVILDQVPIADDAKAALQGKPGPLRNVLDLANAYLAGEWDDVDAGARALGIRASSLPGMFTAAIEWCEMGLADAREAA